MEGLFLTDMEWGLVALALLIPFGYLVYRLKFKKKERFNDSEEYI